MIVLAIGIGTFVVRLVLAELMPLDQSAFYQQIQGIINRGT